MLDKYRAGGAGAGAVAGFFLGGPVGAGIGAIAGWLGGGAVEAHKLAALVKSVNTAVTLSSNVQAVSVKAGGTVAVLPPQGGKIISASPAAVLPATFTATACPCDHVILTVAMGGAINIAWADSSGTPQGTTLTVVTTP